MDDTELGDNVAEHVLKQHDDAEDHGRGADDRGADEDGFSGGFEGVARAITLFKLILGVLEVSVETAIHASRFTVTPTGARYAPRFCFGHRVVTSIDSQTPLTVVNGFRQTQVTYHYKMEDVPIWAKSDDVLTAFPKLATALSGQASDHATLAQTIAGWQVPD